MKKHEPVYVMTPFSKLVQEVGLEEATKEMARRSAMRKTFKGGRPKGETKQVAKGKINSQGKDQPQVL